MNTITETAFKWAKKLGFDDSWLSEIKSYSYPGDLIPYDYKNKALKKINDPMLNLVSYLNYCEEAREVYANLGIPEEIFIDSLNDIKIWAYRYKEVFDRYGVMEIVWLRHLLRGNMFTIGRLEYKLGRYQFMVPRKKLWPFCKIIEIHIPRGPSLTTQIVIDSLNQAMDFFAKYFPKYKYNYFTCGSWMLDPNLKEILPQTSAIIQFQNLFDTVLFIPIADHIRFIFGENVNKKNIQNFVPKTSLQANLQKRILNKEKLGTALGVIYKGNILKDKIKK